MAHIAVCLWDANVWPEAFRILVLYTGLPMLALAILVALVTSARPAQRGP
jgi:hypothetical protein